MVDQLIRKILSREGSEKVGMILSHVGVVRGFSKDGKLVKKIRVEVDHQALEEVLAKARSRPGIFAVEVKINQGELSVGDLLMVLVVAGDFRSRVIETLSQTLDEIKARVTSKQEWAEA